MNNNQAQAAMYSKLRNRIQDEIGTSAVINKFDTCNHVRGNNQHLCFNAYIDFNGRIICGHGRTENEIIDSLKHNLKNDYGVSAKRVELWRTMKNAWIRPELRRLTTVGQLIERLNELPKDRRIVRFEIKHLDKNLLSKFNKIPMKDFTHYVVMAEKAYDVPADDPCLSDDSIDIIAGFYSSDSAFTFAIAINEGRIKIK